MILAASIAAIALSLAALWLLVRDAKGEGALRPVLLAALLSFACVLEPADLAALVVCAAYLFVARPGTLRRYALTVLVVVGPIVLWSERRFHRPFPLQPIVLEPSRAPYLPLIVCAIAFSLVRGGRPIDRLGRFAIAATAATLWFAAISTHGGTSAALAFATVAAFALLSGNLSRSRTIAAATLALAVVLAGKSALARKPRAPEIAAERPPTTRIGLGDRSSDGYVVSGFSGPEGYFRWTAGHRAQLRLPVPAMPSRATHLVVAMQLTPHLADGRRTEQRVELSVSGHAIATWSVKRPQPSLYVARIDRAQLTGGDLLLTLDLPDAVSPAQLGLGGDARELGVAIHSIELRTEGEP